MLSKPCFLIGIFALWSWAPALAAAQVSDATDSKAPSPAWTDESASSEAQLEGLWPSQKLMNLMLARWSDEISREYDLDETQRAKVREAVTKRWGGFLNEHRSTIQPVFNEFVEMRMELEPPSKEQVQTWAERAMPVFQRFREQINQGTEEFREALNPLQRAKFELQALQFGVGLQFAEQKLKQWQNGEVDVNEFWEPVGRGRHRHRDEQFGRRSDRAEQAATADTEPREKDQIALELTSWEEYVRAFIRVYDLDEGQRTAALSVLSEMKNRAAAHRDRHREEIPKLENRIAGFTGSEQELADLKKQLLELYGPVDDMFKELKNRIEQLPTAEQRAAAAQVKPDPEEDSEEPPVPPHD